MYRLLLPALVGAGFLIGLWLWNEPAERLAQSLPAAAKAPEPVREAIGAEVVLQFEESEITSKWDLFQKHPALYAYYKSAMEHEVKSILNIMEVVKTPGIDQLPFFKDARHPALKLQDSLRTEWTGPDTLRVTLIGIPAADTLKILELLTSQFLKRNDKVFQDRRYVSQIENYNWNFETRDWNRGTLGRVERPEYSDEALDRQRIEGPLRRAQSRIELCEDELAVAEPDEKPELILALQHGRRDYLLALTDHVTLQAVLNVSPTVGKPWADILSEHFAGNAPRVALPPPPRTIPSLPNPLAAYNAPITVLTKPRLLMEK